MQSVRKVLAVSTASCWQLVVFWPYGTHWCMQFYSIQLHSLFWITWFGFTANTSTVLLMNDDAALISRFHGVSTCLLNWACISHWKTRSSQLRASEDKVAEVSARVSGRCWLGIWPGTDTKDMTSEQKMWGDQPLSTRAMDELLQSTCARGASSRSSSRRVKRNAG